MASQPTVGGSAGSWGTELNAYLSVGHDATGANLTTATDFGTYSNLDSEGNAMLLNHAYLTRQDGFVSVYITFTATAKVISGYIGATSDPVGAGALVARLSSESTTSIRYFLIPVKSGKYFEITTTEAVNTPDIVWYPVGTALAPVDNN